MIREMDWAAYLGCKVRIYRNLNNGTMSIQVKQDKTWKVVGHVTNAIARDVKFHIQEGGRQRVIRDKKKNVHAWGEGVLIAQFDESIIAPIRLGYDPYTNANFVQRGTTNAIAKTKYLAVRDNLVYVSKDALCEVDRNLKSHPVEFDFFSFAFIAA